MTKRSTADILKIPIEHKLVSVGAFCLMPNHFHLLLMPLQENGVSRFMQKLGTAYSMYFNIKYARTGGLFVSPFRSKHIHNDTFLQYVLQYIHCNPAELFEPQWKEGRVKDIIALEKKLLGYRYSSFGAFSNAEHPLRALLHDAIFNVEAQTAPKLMLEDAQEYYSSLSR